MTQYFFANISGYKHPQAYVFVRLEDNHCGLHGEYIGKQVLGHRIKISGNVESSTDVMSLDRLTLQSRREISKLIIAEEDKYD